MPIDTNPKRITETTSKIGVVRAPIVHYLKCWPQFFDPILEGKKNHDLRRSDDRDFRVGDLIVLREFDEIRGSFTGRQQKVEITYITSADLPCALSSEALHDNFCILSISPVSDQ